jgi:hypothetical protein
MRAEETFPGPSISTPATTARVKPKRLLLVNPRNPLANLNDKTNYWNKYRVWKPLGLLVLAGVTPPEWEITVIDENVNSADYSQIPLPDLVGLTAFTSQAPRRARIRWPLYSGPREYPSSWAGSTPPCAMRRPRVRSTSW